LRAQRSNPPVEAAGRPHLNVRKKENPHGEVAAPAALEPWIASSLTRVAMTGSTLSGFTGPGRPITLPAHVLEDL
jgi:hypothetical protein